MKILLDAGHGGNDPGAVNAVAHVEEEDITLAVESALTELLESAGHDVLHTRIGDTYVSPSARLNLIRQWKPDAFISIHCNAVDNHAAHGIETIYADDYDKELAARVQAELVTATGLTNRGARLDVRGLAVLKDLQTPAILTEIGFLSNADDLAVIQDTRLIAQAIFDGFQSWEQSR